MGKAAGSVPGPGTQTVNRHTFTEGDMARETAPWWWGPSRRGAWAEAKERQARERQPFRYPYVRRDAAQSIDPATDLMNPLNPFSPLSPLHPSYPAYQAETPAPSRPWPASPAMPSPTYAHEASHAPSSDSGYSSSSGSSDSGSSSSSDGGGGGGGE